MLLKSTFDKKRALIEEYETAVGKEGIKRARENNHSTRRPIQCGLTIHPGYDCAYSCIYCYILDMGFKFRKPEPCTLSAKELALALLLNTSFYPGRDGTYIAIGSVTEPFQPELKSLAIRYIEELAKLGNPIQFSSKSHITIEDAKAISSSCNWISPLITVLTMDESKAYTLEPLAPKPTDRLDSMRNLRQAGLKPFLFLRPILPGIITIEDCENLIDESLSHGAEGVVLGSFRVTRRIIGSIEKRKIDVSEILRRSKAIDHRQRSVFVSDLQTEIENKFSKRMRIFGRSCCASAYSAELKQCIHHIAGKES